VEVRAKDERPEGCRAGPDGQELRCQRRQPARVAGEQIAAVDHEDQRHRDDRIDALEKLEVEESGERYSIEPAPVLEQPVEEEQDERRPAVAADEEVDHVDYPTGVEAKEEAADERRARASCPVPDERVHSQGSDPEVE
jgi:hypothetical protein